jgi:ATP-binding cassette subfamily E protein 1
LLEDDLKAVVKPQYVDQIPKAVRSADKTVKTLITSRAQMDNLEEVLDVLGNKYWFIDPFNANYFIELNHVMSRDINQLSGGELQRFAIGAVCVQQADV